MDMPAPGAPAPFGGRLLRAQQIIRDLIGTVHQWAQGDPVRLVGKIREDRLQFTVTLEIVRAPPVEQWGYMFGEAIHQLRAALDNYLVFVARESGITDPQVLRRIQFPIAASRKEWNYSTSRIQHLPAAVRTVIQQVQPFNRGESLQDVKGDLLIMLRARAKTNSQMR
jgi:hypothetical protein